MKGQKKKSQKVTQPEVKQDQEVPEYMRYNKHITSGFRLGHSFNDLVKSLFEWHNETINVWTHLIPAIIVFIILLSSNLYVQHYHDQQEILAFKERLSILNEAIKAQTNSNLSVYNSWGQHRNDLFQTVVTGYLTPIKRAGDQIERLLDITKEDQLPIKDKIINRLKKLEMIKQQLDRVAMMLSVDQTNFTETNLRTLGLRMDDAKYRVTNIFNDVIQVIQKMAQQINPIPKWPILVFLISASICLWCSVCYHLFAPYSHQVRKVLRTLDYAGVILLIVGSGFPMLVYGSECLPSFKFYLIFASFLGISTFIALVTGFFQPKERYKYKSLMFMTFGLSYLVPLLHMFLLQNYWHLKFDTMQMTQYLIQYLLLGGVYILGAVIYTLRCPERYGNGAFDHCGASHQIWHIFVVIGLYITYEVTWDIYYKRRITHCIGA